MIHAYLKYHELAWSPVTSDQAASLIGKYMPEVTSLAEDVWGRLAALSPYSRNTVWTRLTHYYQWLLEHRYVTGENTFRAFAKKNRRLFRGAYRPEKLSVTFEEAERRLATLSDGDIRRTAYRMLYGAQRWSDKTCGDGFVVGKGQKVRPDYSPESLRGGSAPYYKTWRALKRIDLKPHTLRKLALNRMVERGATAADLMEVAGWSSINTAVAYLQPKEHSRLKEMLR